MTVQLEGILRKEWPYQYNPNIAGTWISRYINERISEIPEGAYVRLIFEVIDPHPQQDKK